jgi:folate-binding protein YgfZ
MQQTPVAVENHSPFDFSILIRELRIFGGIYFPEEDRAQKIFKILGSDSEDFLQGQLTNDVKALTDKTGQWTCRLNRTGKVIGFGLLIKIQKNEFYFLGEETPALSLVQDLNKFIISEEVEIEELIQKFAFVMGPKASIVSEFTFPFLQDFAGLVFNFENIALPKIQPEVLEIYRKLAGHPLWSEISEKKFINETMLEEMGISYQKGCFLGQETVAKIKNNRGAATYPVLIRSSEEIKNAFRFDDLNYALVELPREQRIHKRIQDFDGSQVEVYYLPFFKTQNIEDRIIEIYSYASLAFQQENNLLAISYLKWLVSLDPIFEDAYESLGVIYGKVGDYGMAHIWLDKLVEVNPKSTLAHTNKSLLYMRQGKITEAENEKAKATVNSFSAFGAEAKIKKEQIEKNLKEAKEREIRKKMFLDVLAIDLDDEMANFGLADIAFAEKSYDVSFEYLNKLLKTNQMHSKSLLLLGKYFEIKKDYSSAKKTYEEGIVLATKKGDFKTANELQERVSKLIL